MSRVFALAACFAVAVSAAHASEERWVFAKARDGALGYDAASVTRDATAGTAKGHTVIYSPQELAWDELRYNFMVQEVVFDCRKNAYRADTIVLMDASKQVVEILTSEGGDWVSIDDGATGLFKQLVCDGAALTNSKESNDMFGALDMMKAIAAP